MTTSITLILLIAALIGTLAAANNWAPLWPSVLVVEIALLLQYLPK